MINFRLSSRITNLKNLHLLQPSFERSNDGRSIWVLREDELGGFWGTKFRKYASILEHCRRENISRIICTGGINSNNLAAAAILCAEFGLKVFAFAVEDHSDNNAPATGNRLILKTALAPDQLILVPRSERHTVDTRMQELSVKLNTAGCKTLVLHEGGGCIEAVPGAITLADEVVRQRREWHDNKIPDHIFIDSGTGLSAASLAAGLVKHNASRKTKLHVIQMAGFEEQIKNAFESWVTPVTGVNWEETKNFLRVYRPLSPKSYGATSKELFAFIQMMAREHGILTDPVYSAKLFARAFDLIEGQNLRGRILIIHTGGLSGLLGYSFK